ncbi:MAG: secretin N-terminal domain-containing protein [Planctomycetota bacterium]
MIAPNSVIRWTRLLTLFSATFLLLSAEVMRVASAQPPGVSPEQIERFREMRRRGGRRGGPPRDVQPQPTEPKPEEKKEEKKEEESDEKKEDVKTIMRPTDGSVRLDPNRIRLTPDKNGLVQFNYNGQPWSDVLQEFADAAKLTFDWQELPADRLNLVTQKKYNLQQARDLLNSRLLARGFTLVVQGELLSAVKIEKLDASLVPRVEADDLEDYMPHDFVRVRFQLPDAMDPARAKEDVKALLNPKATVIPLLATKRLLVIDAVTNLRSVRDLIYDEQSAADSIIKPEIYPIKHRRADYVADQIMIVLGLDPASRKSPQELQLETQRMQLLMQMSQQKKDVSKLLKPDGLPVHIAVDRQQNTLMVNAPADLKSTIERTIKQIDQPPGGAMVATVGGRSTRPHKTTTASTDAVVSALTEFGQLDPLTRLQSDSKTKTIFAYATEADHQKIVEMIKKIDSTGREIHVVQLRRYSASAIAGTLTSMFGQAPKKKKETSRRRSFFFGMSDDEEEKQELTFKAMPDVENNRLIIWANAEELAEVNKMLTRLGESPEGVARNPSKLRELRGRTPEETARLLERLKAAYPGQLNIDDSALRKEPEEEPQPVEEDKVTRRFAPSRVFRTVQLSSDDLPAEDNANAPPINITVTQDGRIVMSSDDAAALDQLESLVEAIEPPQRQEFVKFKLEYVRASSVAFKLEDYFEEELKGQTESVFDEWGEYEGKKEKDLGPITLGRRELLRFISEDYTNTVVVQGASPSQLRVIKQLIDIYDVAPKPNKNYLSRKTKVIKLKYSRAQDIANSLKEVYRELLSSKDKEFKDEEGGSSIIGNETTYVFGKRRIDETGKEDPVYIKFDGMLAVGVDQISNALIVSAREEVLESIEETVKLLDEAAKPNTMIHVHRVGGGIKSAEDLQKMLKESLSRPWPGGKPEQAAAKPSGKGQPEQPQQPRDSGGDRRRRGR